MPLKDRVAIITGAARGIGRACAERFFEAGAEGIVLADIDAAGATAAAVQMDPGGERVLAIQADLTRREEVEEMVETTLAKFGAIDILVNNAGIAGPPGGLEEHGEEALDEIFAVNVKKP